jgi:hypothetical protein
VRLQVKDIQPAEKLLMTNVKWRLEQPWEKIILNGFSVGEFAAALQDEETESGPRGNEDRRPVHRRAVQGLARSEVHVQAALQVKRRIRDNDEKRS